MNASLLLRILALFPAVQESEYFPLQEGTEWTYRERFETTSDQWKVGKNAYVDWLDVFLKSTSQAKRYPDFPYLPPKEKNEVTVTCGKAKDAKTGCVKIAYEEGISLDLLYERDGEGIRLVSKTISVDGKVVVDNRIEKPERFLKLPFKNGARWKYGVFEVEYKGPEEVKVEAGTFTCARLELMDLHYGPDKAVCSITGYPKRISIWLAPGVGIVKQEWIQYSGGGPFQWTVTSTRELVRFKKPQRGK